MNVPRWTTVGARLDASFNQRDIMHMCAHIYSESWKYFSFLSSVQYKSGRADILPGHGRAVAVISPAKFSVIAIYHSVSDHAITSDLSRYDYYSITRDGAIWIST